MYIQVGERKNGEKNETSDEQHMQVHVYTQYVLRIYM